jgi:hypothetical protein
MPISRILQTMIDMRSIVHTQVSELILKSIQILFGDVCHKVLGNLQRDPRHTISYMLANQS